MGMVKQLAKLTTFVLFAALVVMRSHVIEFYEQSKIAAIDFYTNTFSDSQQPTDIISLSKNTNPPGIDVNNNNGVNFSKNKDLFLNEIVPRLSQIQARNEAQNLEKLSVKTEAISTEAVNKSPSDIKSKPSDDDSFNFTLEEEPASNEIEAVRMIAAEKFAKLKAELDSLKYEEEIKNTQQEIKQTPIINNKQTVNSRERASPEPTTVVAQATVAKQKQVITEPIVTEKAVAINKLIVSKNTSLSEPEPEPEPEFEFEKQINNTNNAQSNTTSTTMARKFPNENPKILAKLNTRLDTRIRNSSVSKSKKVEINDEDETLASLISNKRKISKNILDDDEMVIIVNSNNNQSITFSDIKNMYNDRITSWPNGTKIQLYNLPIDSPTRKKFSKQILNQTSWEAAKAVSNRVITNVLRNSMEVKTARLVVSTVSKNTNAIGYAPYKNVKGRDNLRIILPVN